VKAWKTFLVSISVLAGAKLPNTACNGFVGFCAIYKHFLALGFCYSYGQIIWYSYNQAPFFGLRRP